MVGGSIYILLLDVDNILALVDAKEAEHLKMHLTKHFGTVRFEIGAKLSYLGMQLNIRDEGMLIDMCFFVK
jgi:hypothetical protein